MFRIVLFEPEIPPNTGNVIRLCANTGAELHLVRPLGFDLDRRSLRRAGLDYRWMARVHVHDDFAACERALGSTPAAPRWRAIETGAARRYDEHDYRAGDALLFGSERRGLPEAVLARVGPAALASIPMQEGNRSLNLSNAVALVVYEAWRQNDFRVAATPNAPLPEHRGDPNLTAS
ncbi:MAG: tRNA (cytidine(34)-2'-O)-methyltransferase [Steroidobacteraceae bacterium]